MQWKAGVIDQGRGRLRRLWPANSVQKILNNRNADMAVPNCEINTTDCGNLNLRLLQRIYFFVHPVEYAIVF